MNNKFIVYLIFSLGAMSSAFGIDDKCLNNPMFGYFTIKKNMIFITMTKILSLPT